MMRLSGQSIRLCLSIVLIWVLLAPGVLAADRGRLAIEAMVFHPFSKDVVAFMLPIIFTGASAEAKSDLSLSLVDTVHCRTEDHGGVGKFLGILYPGTSAGRRIVSVLREEDCHGSAPTILKRLIANPDTPHWIGLVELDVKWTPWQVQFTPTKLQGLAKSQHPKVDVHLPHDATRVYPTSFKIPAENGKFIPVHVAVGLADKAFVLNGLVVETPPAHYSPTFTEKVPEKLPSGANAIIAIPHTVANTVVTQYLAGEAYVIPVIPSAPALTVKSPVMTGSRNKYATTSLLGLKEYPDAFNLETEWTGDDLRLSKLSLTPRRTACGSGMVCDVKRAGLEALATSLTGLLRAQYKDMPLRSLILQDVMSVKLNDKDVRVRAEVLQAESTATDLILYTKLTLTVP
ncbi:MAG TPA: hypothetical protein VFI05_04555 [Nitrospiraceae bacterium]|nr:hypothetical protein [Nitrospiraceae bacterium]